MKKHIATLLIAIVITVTAQAQGFEIGANAGTTCYPALVKNTFSFGDTRNKFGNYGLSVLKNTKKWQYGVSLDYNENDYSYKVPANVMLDFFGNPAVEPVMYESGYTHVHHENLKLFANRKVAIRKFEVYAGASVGDELNEYSYSGVRYISDEITGTQNLLTAGLQVGGTWYVKKHIGINAQAAGVYNFDIKDAVKGQVAFPLTLGIRYRL